MTNQQGLKQQSSRNDCTISVHYILASHAAVSTNETDNELKPFSKLSFNGFLNTINSVPVTAIQTNPKRHTE